MTDTAPRLTLCEGFPPDIAGCYLYMPADTKQRAEHRRWHTHELKVTNALREANKELASTVRQQSGRINELERALNNINIPEAVEPLTIVAANDLEPLEDDEELEPDIDDLDEIATHTVIPGPDETQPYTDIYPAIDRDDDLDTRLANATRIANP